MQIPSMIVRKSLHIILALLILVITTGFTVSIHYCHGEFVSLAVDHDAKHCCHDSKSCCSDATVYIKMEGDFLKTLLNYDKHICAPVVITSSSHHQLALYSNFQQTFSVFLIKPHPPDRDVLAEHQFFLI
jgi:hypothetical protein